MKSSLLHCDVEREGLVVWCVSLCEGERKLKERLFSSPSLSVLTGVFREKHYLILQERKPFHLFFVQADTLGIHTMLIKAVGTFHSLKLLSMVV